MIDVLAALMFLHVLQGKGLGKLNRMDVTFRVHIVNKTNSVDPDHHLVFVIFP